RAPARDDVDWAEVDLLEQDSLTDALKGCGPVFHLAAMADVNDVIAQPAESVAITVLGAARVLEAARRADAGRGMLASTGWGDAAGRRGRGGDAVRPHGGAAHLRVEQARGRDVLRRLRDPLRPPVHGVALRHSVRAAHAQRPRRGGVHRARAARRAAPYRRRR